MMWRWGPVVLYMAIIFGLSSMPSPPSGPPGLSDKDLHAVLYFGLVVLVVRALAGGLRRAVDARTAVLAVAICTVYGITDEIHQHFVPPRQMDVFDAAADTVGASIAAAGLFAIGRIRPG
jgi:VanZ family protein